MAREEWFPDIDDFTRKDAALEKVLADVRDGDHRKSTENSVIADNETAWEIGAFAETQPAADAYRDGLIVRARRDAMAAKLNSIDILDTVVRLEQALRNTNQQLSTLRFLIVALLAFGAGAAFLRLF